MYKLILMGFLNQRTTTHQTIEECRQAWQKAAKEIFPATSLGITHQVNWSGWELYKNNELISQGEFKQKAIANEA